jgi:hypothetical protein
VGLGWKVEEIGEKVKEMVGPWQKNEGKKVKPWPDLGGRMKDKVGAIS